VEVVAFGKTTSSRLIDAADDYTDLGQDTKRYLIAQQRILKLIPDVRRFARKDRNNN
jgi:uncharacterized LabA/DUF88 family protein